MPKYYYSVPSLYQRNVYLEKKIKNLKDLNTALKNQIAELLNSKNGNQEQMLPQTEQRTDVYLYFSYKQQIKQKIQEIKDLEEQCSKIFYQSKLRSIDPNAANLNDEDAQLNGNQDDLDQRNIMRQRPGRRVEEDIDENQQGINGRKMTKTQSLQRKKQQKRVQHQNRNHIAQVQDQQWIVNEIILQQILEENNSPNPNPNINSGLQNINPKDLLPPLQFLKELMPEEQISHRYKTSVSDHQSERNQSEEKTHLNLQNKRFSMEKFLKYDWRKIEKLGFNNCQLKTEDWNLFCDHHYLFKNLKTLVLTRNLIEVVKGEQIQKFPSLIILNFGIDSCGKPNPLTRQTIEKLQQWEKQRKNPNLLFLYRQPKNEKVYHYPKPVQRPVQHITKVLKQTQCIDYLKKVFRSFNPLGSQYCPISNATKDSQNQRKGVKYSENSFYLIHNFAQPVMQDFIKQNWYEFEQMRFCNCRMTDEDWQAFTANAQQYPHLKSLLLNGNFISEVRYEDLEKLKELKYLQIEGNNLSERSICDIEQFKQKHKDVKILY